MLKCIILTLLVVKVVQVRKYRELIGLLRTIQDKLIGQQTEVRELIADGFVLLHCEFEDEPPQATAWHQYAQPLSSLLVIGHLAQLLDKVLVHFLDERLKALVSLLFA